MIAEHARGGQNMDQDEGVDQRKNKGKTADGAGVYRAKHIQSDPQHINPKPRATSDTTTTNKPPSDLLSVSRSDAVHAKVNRAAQHQEDARDPDGPAKPPVSLWRRLLKRAGYSGRRAMIYQPCKTIGRPERGLPQEHSLKIAPTYWAPAGVKPLARPVRTSAALTTSGVLRSSPSLV